LRGWKGGGTLAWMRLSLPILLAFVALLAVASAPAGAVSGTAGTGSAGAAQYPQSVPAGDEGEILGEQETGGGVQPDRQRQAGGDEGAVGGADEVAAVGDDAGLPFTGLALIALLITGTALLGAGFLLRRRTR